MAKAIEIRDVSKSYHIYDRPSDRLRELISVSHRKYHREFVALNSVSLDVEPGEMLGIIGRNGSGKSTLLKIICGVLTPSSGVVKAKGRISALLELGTGFNPEFSGRENAYFNGTLMGFTESEMDSRIEAIEEFADIGEFIDQPVKKYSSGMYVRLAFACAINVDPEILVVDEALAVGDVFFQQKCYRKIAEFREKGKTIILVTHSTGDIMKNCDRAVLMEAGRVAASGDPKTVVNKYLESMTADKGGTVCRAVGKDRDDLPPDTCPDMPAYNPNEYRYGNCDAVVTGFRVLGEDGSDIISVGSSEVFRFRYEVRFLTRVENPIYGFAVNTKDGLTVYGTNSILEDMDAGPVEAGESVVVEFSQPAGLIAGDYFLTAGIARQVGDDVEPLDRRYDLALLRVTPTGKQFGIANLMTRMSVRPGRIAGDEG